MEISTVEPGIGFRAGCVYKRLDIHRVYGGARQSGVSLSKSEPVVFLFATNQWKVSHYPDEWDERGVHWFCAQGSSGNQKWTGVNKAIRDHHAVGRELLYFEGLKGPGGLWKYIGSVVCIGHRRSVSIGLDGNERSIIQFGLVPSSVAEFVNSNDQRVRLMSMADSQVLSSAKAIPAKFDKLRPEYARDPAIKRHALERAGGVCERCKLPAPFVTLAGNPYLEVHHIEGLAESGLDSIDNVAAVCPNCHRQAHHGVDAHEIKEQLLGVRKMCQ